MHLYLASVSASKMLRRRIPQSGHLMTAKKFWLQTVPCNVSDTTMDQMHCFLLLQDCDIVITFPPNTGEAVVAWLQDKLKHIPGLNIITKSLNLSSNRFKLSSCFAFQITASYPA